MQSKRIRPLKYYVYVLWAAPATLALVSVGVAFFAIGYINFREAHKKIESKLSDTALIVSRRLAAEILLGPSGEPVAVGKSLQSELGLDSIRILDDKPPCLVGAKVECSGFSKEKVTVFRKIEHISRIAFVEITVRGPNLFSSLNFWLLGWGILPLCFVLIFGFLLQNYFLRHFVVGPIQSLALDMGGVSQDTRTVANANVEVSGDHLQTSSHPVRVQEIEDIRKGIEEAQKMRLSYAVSKAQIEISAQVSHDIRSPLTALDLIVGDMAGLSEDKRIVVRSAVTRIRDIANDLLDRRMEVLGNSSDVADVSEPQLLSALIDSIMTEKRIQHRSRFDFSLEFQITNASFGIFSKVEKSIFKRVFSNVVDNAIESLTSGGAVQVSLSLVHDLVQIVVSDNGVGISPEVLPRLMRRGETFGKAKGSGLGLFYAHNCILGWGGKISIESKLGQGTSVIIGLPHSSAPRWFLSELPLPEGCEVLVVDDDSSIHGVWKGRFEGLSLRERNIAVTHLSGPKEAEAWLRTREVARPVVFLCDFEFQGEVTNGIQLVETSQTSRAYLVTSRYEEKHVRTACDRIGLKIIPKELATYLPIVVTVEKVFDAVLIDDDPLIRESWARVARKKGKTFVSFASFSEFMKFTSNLNKSTPIYIDVILSNGERGEEVSRQVSEMGFLTIFLSTGFSQCSIPKISWIAGVRGKEPPWL